MYLLDTDICVSILRGNGALHKKLKNLSPQTEVFTTIINVAELYYGAFLSSRQQEQRERVEDIISRLKILFLDVKSAIEFASVKAELKKANNLIPDNDLYIGSMAKSSGLVLVTHNAKHFQRIPNLKMEDWLAA